ncbi:MAG: T9SS type A sorting domain-containing protein [Bacteroidota bacterium]
MPSATHASFDASLSGLTFAENNGQWADEVRFRARLGGATAWVTDDALVFDFYTLGRDEPSTDRSRPDALERDNLEALTRRGHVIAMRFEGVGAGRAVARGPQAGYHSYFLGDDPSRWASRVALYDEVVLEDLYDGIDLRLYDDGGELRCDLVLAPGADLGQVQMRLDGADGLALTESGAVRMETSLGPVEHRGLLAYQDDAVGRRDVVESAFVLGADGTLGFAAEHVDPSRALVIDPLIWSTFLGGARFEWLVDTAVSSDGTTTVAGYADGSDFPTTPGAYDTGPNGNYDVVVTKLSADGSNLVWSTVLGGTGEDYGRALALGESGEITVAGSTESLDFPTTAGAYDGVQSGERDGFVARLSSDGTTLLWSTFLGGSYSDGVTDVALTSSGNALVVGSTTGTDFPTTGGAYDVDYNGGFSDAFVTQLTADGSTLVWSTFLGGAGPNYGAALALSASGDVIITGDTRGVDFPTTANAYDSSPNGLNDAFVTRLTADGSALVWSTLLGGSGSEFGNDLALGMDEEIVLVGSTRGDGFPTTDGAYDANHNGSSDGFATRFSADGSALLWSTFIGGPEIDYASAVAVDASGSVTLVGSTRSPTFPTTPGAFDRTCGSDSRCNFTSQAGHKYDAFVTRLSPDGTVLTYSTFLGGSGSDYGNGLALSAEEQVTVVGRTFGGPDFPVTPGAYNTSYEYGYVTRLDVDGAAALMLTAEALSPLTVPRGGSVQFEYTVTNATAAPASGDLFFTVQRGGSTVASAVVASGTVLAGQSVTGTFTQQVPSTAPTGDYAYDLSIGQSPNVAVDTESFTATVTDARGGAATETWAVRAVTPWPSESAAPQAASRTGLPETVALAVYPNPFAGEATVSVALPSTQTVTLLVFDLLGREVLRLAEGEMAAGRHAVLFDGSGLPSGVYLLRLATVEQSQTQQVTLVR